MIENKRTHTPDDVQPLVSIGMPVWNCQRTVAMAIQSVLCQTYPHWELVIVDDGSTDATLSVVRTFDDPRIRVFADGHHRKISARLNQSIEYSRGRYFARMDGDDIAYPDRLQLQVAYLRTHPDVDLVGGSMLVFHEDYRPRGKRASPEDHQDICRDPLSGFGLAHPTFMGRLSWFRRNLYDETMSLIEDQELLLRTYRNSRFANVPSILLGYREDRINLRNNLKGRRMLFQLQATQLVAAGQWSEAARSGFIHFSKGSVYVLCALLHQMDTIMKVRARTPLTEAEIQEWSMVCRTVAEERQCAYSMS